MPSRYIHSKLKYLLPLFLLFSFSLTAQTDDSTGYTREHIFEHLDLSQVPSGLLYDWALPLVALELYDGLSPNDTNVIGQMGYRMAFATLSGAALTLADVLPDPADHI